MMLTGRFVCRARAPAGRLARWPKCRPMSNWRQKALAIFLRRKFRPWALLTPILVFMVALPLLRPLRAPGMPAQGEALLLDTVRAISTTGGMALDHAKWEGKPGTVISKRGVIADRPPVFAVLLAPTAWSMQKLGYKFDSDADVIAYVLTLVGTTIPVAIGGATIYRMGRLFELTRPRRALLALLVTFGGGWISYATVLNPHATAASALVCSTACLLYLAAARRSHQVLAILLLAGFLAGLAAALSPWSLPLVLPLPLVLFAMSIPVRQKVIGFGLLTLGAMPIAWLHTAWSLDAYGSVFAPGSKATLRAVVSGEPGDAPIERFTSLSGELFNVTLGGHGLFTHFPILIAAIVGLFIVLRKHWPMHAKVFGAIVFVGTITIVMLVAARRTGTGDWRTAGQWFVVFLPLATFWLGAILRRELNRRAFWLVTAACVVSVTVSLAGAGWRAGGDDGGHGLARAFGWWVERSPSASDGRSCMLRLTSPRDFARKYRVISRADS